MANIILMPQKGVSEESAVLAEWYIQVGDTVKTGDKLFSIENGKLTDFVGDYTEYLEKSNG